MKTKFGQPDDIRTWAVIFLVFLVILLFCASCGSQRKHRTAPDFEIILYSGSQIVSRWRGSELRVAPEFVSFSEFEGDTSRTVTCGDLGVVRLLDNQSVIRGIFPCVKVSQ